MKGGREEGAVQEALKAQIWQRRPEQPEGGALPAVLPAQPGRGRAVSPEELFGSSLLT